jgi:geranyl-CoA carboxylase alpha subunit
MRTLLIVNRGEIACRIVRTARAMGIATVAVYTAPDAGALHVRSADSALEIPSYLSIPDLIGAARRAGADAVHPGYGFLSENPEFAQACRDAGLIFVGPSPAAIRAMGSKRLAKRRVADAGVPVLPGYDGEDQSEATLLREAERIGLPLMVKASAGGGGKGLRLVTEAADLPAALARARAEAESAFGDGELILERALAAPRHVEVQVFGDAHGNILHLGERDCSVQRRHQKVIEEAPSPAVGAELRGAMGAAAVAAARSVDYVGAGTVEFLLNADGGFYFMEMNTRLQVEHPVTEAVTGLDLVEWQLRVARGERLPLAQDEVTLEGHAIEARLYAEAPYDDFLPQAGRLLAWRPPPGVRIDHGLHEGAEVTPHFDPMLAKLIAHGTTRDEARQRLARALEALRVHGVVTNRAFLKRIVEHPAFSAGEATTAFLAETRFERPNPPPEAKAAAAMALARPGWWSHGDPRVPIRLEGEAMRVGREDVEISGERIVPAAAEVTVEGDAAWLDHEGETWRFVETPLGAAAARRDAPDTLIAPMPGLIVELAVAMGDRVEKGQKLLVMEAMKMQLELKAPGPGIVAELAVKAGDQVAARTLLVRLELDA